MKLTLRAGSNSWQRFKLRKSSSKFTEVRKKVALRDRRTCQFCNYKKGADLEVININGDYQNNSPKNLATACSLCAKAQLLDAYLMDYTGPDKMVYLPELTQVQLHHLIRIAFCETRAEGEAAYNAKMILAQLQDRAAWLDQQLNSQLSHPAVFATYLNLPNADKALIAKIRWLPGLESYAELIPTWQEALELG